MTFVELVLKAISSRPPPGYAPIPRGRKGGYRKMVGGKYDYWYPPKAGKPQLEFDLFGRLAPKTTPIEEVAAEQKQLGPQMGLFESVAEKRAELDVFSSEELRAEVDQALDTRPIQVEKPEPLTPEQELEAFGQELAEAPDRVRVPARLVKIILSLSSLKLLKVLRLAVSSRLRARPEPAEPKSKKTRGKDKRKRKKRAPGSYSLAQLLAVLDKRIAQLELPLEKPKPEPKQKRLIPLGGPTWNGVSIGTHQEGNSPESDAAHDELESSSLGSVISNGAVRFVHFSGWVPYLGPATGPQEGSEMSGWHRLEGDSLVEKEDPSSLIQWGTEAARPLSSGGLIYTMRELGGDWSLVDRVTVQRQFRLREQDPPSRLKATSLSSSEAVESWKQRVSPFTPEEWAVMSPEHRAAVTFTGGTVGLQNRVMQLAESGATNAELDAVLAHARGSHVSSRIVPATLSDAADYSWRRSGLTAERLEGRGKGKYEIETTQPAAPGASMPDHDTVSFTYAKLRSYVREVFGIGRLPGQKSRQKLAEESEAGWDRMPDSSVKPTTVQATPELLLRWFKDRPLPPDEHGYRTLTGVRREQVQHQWLGAAPLQAPGEEPSGWITSVVETAEVRDRMFRVAAAFRDSLGTETPPPILAKLSDVALTQVLSTTHRLLGPNLGYTTALIDNPWLESEEAFRTQAQSDPAVMASATIWPRLLAEVERRLANNIVVPRRPYVRGKRSIAEVTALAGKVLASLGGSVENYALDTIMQDLLDAYGPLVWKDRMSSGNRSVASSGNFGDTDTRVKFWTLTEKGRREYPPTRSPVWLAGRAAGRGTAELADFEAGILQGTGASDVATVAAEQGERAGEPPHKRGSAALDDYRAGFAAGRAEIDRPETESPPALWGAGEKRPFDPKDPESLLHYFTEDEFSRWTDFQELGAKEEILAALETLAEQGKLLLVPTFGIGRGYMLEYRGPIALAANELYTEVHAFSNQVSAVYPAPGSPKAGIRLRARTKMLRDLRELPMRGMMGKGTAETFSGGVWTARPGYEEKLSQARARFAELKASWEETLASIKAQATAPEKRYADQYRKYLAGEGRYPKSRGRSGVSQERMEELVAEINAEKLEETPSEDNFETMPETESPPALWGAGEKRPFDPKDPESLLHYFTEDEFSRWTDFKELGAKEEIQAALETLVERGKLLGGSEYNNRYMLEYRGPIGLAAWGLTSETHAFSTQLISEDRSPERDKLLDALQELDMHTLSGKGVAETFSQGVWTARPGFAEKLVTLRARFAELKASWEEAKKTADAAPRIRREALYGNELPQPSERSRIRAEVFGRAADADAALQEYIEADPALSTMGEMELRDLASGAENELRTLFNERDNALGDVEAAEKRDAERAEKEQLGLFADEELDEPDTAPREAEEPLRKVGDRVSFEGYGAGREYGEIVAVRDRRTLPGSPLAQDPKRLIQYQIKRAKRRAIWVDEGDVVEPTPSEDNFETMPEAKLEALDDDEYERRILELATKIGLEHSYWSVGHKPGGGAITTQDRVPNVGRSTKQLHELLGARPDPEKLKALIDEAVSEVVRLDPYPDDLLEGRSQEALIREDMDRVAGQLAGRHSEAIRQLDAALSAIARATPEANRLSSRRGELRALELLARHFPKDEGDVVEETPSEDNFETMPETGGEIERPEATSPVAVPIQTEGEIRAEVVEAKIRDQELDDKISEQYAEKKTKGTRKKDNLDALEIIERAAKAGRGLTNDELVVIARYTGEGGVGDDLNQYYTRPDLASAVWSLVTRYAEGPIKKALEPACGVGVFLQTAPRGVQLTGVEIDGKGSSIAAALHGGRHKIQHSSLEEYAVQQTGKAPEMDAVVTNAPFCTRTGGLTRFHKPLILSADRYFLDTALDQVKDGGVVSMIVHGGILNSSSHGAREFRERLLARAELVDAYRLPGEAFAHTHTSVVSDVIVLRKRDTRVGNTLLKAQTQGYLEDVLGAFDGYDKELVAGNYFESRPERVLGTALTADETGWRSTVTGDPEKIASSIERLSAAGDGGGPATTRIEFTDLEELAGKNTNVKRDLERALTAIKADKPPRVGSTRMIGTIRYLYIGDPPTWRPMEDVDDVTQIIQQSGDEAITLAGDLAMRLGYLQGVIAEGDFYKARAIRRRLAERVKAWVADYGIPSSHRALVELSRSAPPLLDFLASVNSKGVLSDLLSKDAAVIVSKAEVDRTNLVSVAEHVAARSGGYVTLEDVRNNWDGAEGLDEDQLRQALLGTELFAHTVHGWQHYEDYLTGELHDKLDEETARLEGTVQSWEREALERQIAALQERIQSKHKSLDDVDLQLRVASWIPNHILEAWLNAPETQKVVWWGNRSAKVKIRIRDNMWEIGTERTNSSTGEKTWHWSADNTTLLKYMNRISLHREKVEDLVATVEVQFNEWLRGSAYRTELEDTYNRIFRGDFRKSYSGEPLGFEPVQYDKAGNVQKAGLNPKIVPHAFQNECIRWAEQTGKGIIALDVGLGKTFAGILLARLLKQKGKARLPFVVVPKSVATNWEEEVETLTPGSRVLVIGETRKPNRKAKSIVKKAKKEGRELTAEETELVAANTRAVSDTADQRNQKLAMLKQNEYDLVICTKPAFERIPLRDETVQRYSDDDFWNTRAAGYDKATGLGTAETAKKALEKLKASWGAAAAAREFTHATNLVYWEDVGVDCLLADEAHAYKNLHKLKTRYGKSPKFLGGSGESKQAQKMQFMARFVREASPDNSVYFMTATPTKNSPLEIYNMIAHIAPEAFEKIGIRNAEEFIDRFCRLEQRMILSAPGGKKKKDDGEGTSEEFEGAGNLVSAECVTGFQNLSELEGILDKYVMARTAQDVGLKIPDADHQLHAVDMTEDQQEVYRELRQEAAELDSKEDPGGLFRIMDRMKKAAQDLELYDPVEYKGWHTNSPKYKAVVAAALEGARERGGQIIFCDHNASHQRLKDMLIAGGLKPEEIGILNAKAAKSSDARQAIGDRFNRNEIKVVIGNTGTMGEGVNLQGKHHAAGTTDIHHLDQPWDPGTMHQRNGRGVRQGNKAAQVQLHNYVSKASFDGFRLGTLKGKESWLQRLRSGADELANDASQGVDDLDILVMLSDDPEAARAKVAEMRSSAESAWYAKMAHADIQRYYKLQKQLDRLRKFEKKKATSSIESVRPTVERLRRQLLRSEILPETIKQDIRDSGDDLRFTLAMTSLEGEGDDRRLVATLLRQGAVLEREQWGKTQRYTVEGFVPAKNQAKLRAWGTVPVLGYDADVLSDFQLVDATEADEVRTQLNPEELKHYSYPLEKIGHIRSSVLESERGLIEQTVRSWMGQFSQHDDLVPVELAGGKVGVVALETTWTSEQRQAVAERIETKVVRSKERSSRARARLRADHPASWERRGWEAESAKAAELRAGGDGENIGARLLLPFGETEARLVGLVAGSSDLVNEYSSPELSALATLAGSRKGALYTRILSAAKQQRKTTAKAAA